MENIAASQSVSNQVLQDGHRRSGNFFQSDEILMDFLAAHFSSDARDFVWPLLMRQGTLAATTMDDLSLLADQNGPRLRKRDRWGETIDQIEFHPAYWELMRIAVESGMMRVKWEPALRQRFVGQRHKMGFAIGTLFAMSESGQYCPLCMTDGVALLIDQFCSDEDKSRLLPHIFTDQPSDFFTGAMFLTEKAGGSDVGANQVRAELREDGSYSLLGEKWFCSNVNAQIIFALARTQEEVRGTRGLSIFLVERQLQDGNRNPIEIVRLKDKLGTRSMASGECLLNGTKAKMVGDEFQGFRVMTEMINLSRLYNSVAAMAGGRRALVEAWQFLSFRVTFGKIAVEHALVRAKFWELGAMNLASFYLVWRTIQAMDNAEAGDTTEAELLRLLTPMAKRESAEMAVYVCRESMELMGGMGYIEESVIPKIMRDVMVLPIWEGAGNIMILDMLRASSKSKGLQLMLAEIDASCEIDLRFGEAVRAEMQRLSTVAEGLNRLAQDEMEYQAKAFFLDLTRCYQASLLLRQLGKGDGQRYVLALEWLLRGAGGIPVRSTPPSPAELRALIGWQF